MAATPKKLAQGAMAAATATLYTCPGGKARAVGAVEAFLEVAVDNDGAIALYEALGFVVVREDRLVRFRASHANSF